MARSFFVIYVRQIRTRTTVVVTWSALTFMVGFWTWHLALGGTAAEKAPPPSKKVAPASAGKNTPPEKKTAAAGRWAVTLHVEGIT
jgi:hypothetical protein